MTNSHATREIGSAAGISSTSVVDYNLRVLERDGYLRRDREVSRGLGLSAASERFGRPRMVRIPLVGRIAAGEPIEAVSGEQEALEFSANLISDDCYALQVKGKSMIEDLIDDGDIVVVRPQETANNGDIVVALLMAGTPLFRSLLLALFGYRPIGVVDEVMVFAFLEEFAQLSEAIRNHSKVIVLSSSISPEDINKASTNPYVYKYINKYRLFKFI